MLATNVRWNSVLKLENITAAALMQLNFHSILVTTETPQPDEIPGPGPTQAVIRLRRRRATTGDKANS
jgi:hypothetical protein